MRGPCLFAAPTADTEFLVRYFSCVVSNNCFQLLIDQLTLELLGLAEDTILAVGG